MNFEHLHGLIYVTVQLDYADQCVELRAIVDTGSAGTAANINLVDYPAREIRWHGEKVTAQGT